MVGIELANSSQDTEQERAMNLQLLLPLLIVGHCTNIVQVVGSNARSECFPDGYAGFRLNTLLRVLLNSTNDTWPSFDTNHK